MKIFCYFIVFRENSGQKRFLVSDVLNREFLDGNGDMKDIFQKMIFSERARKFVISVYTRGKRKKKFFKQTNPVD